MDGQKIVFLRIVARCSLCMEKRKRKDSLETRAVLLIFSLELEISGVAVQSIHQNSKNGDFC